jgi:YHS domain-containing protein
MEVTRQSADVARTACGGKLKDTRDFPSALYGDERIYFCHQACLRVFEQSPDAFMTDQIEHPKKED